MSIFSKKLNPAEQYQRDLVELNGDHIHVLCMQNEFVVGAAPHGLTAYTIIPSNHPDRQCTLEQIQAIYPYPNITIWKTGHIGIMTGTDDEFNPERYDGSLNSSELKKPYRSLAIVKEQMHYLCEQIHIRQYLAQELMRAKQKLEKLVQRGDYNSVESHLIHVPCQHQRPTPLQRQNAFSVDVNEVIRMRQMGGNDSEIIDQLFKMLSNQENNVTESRK